MLLLYFNSASLNSNLSASSPLNSSVKYVVAAIILLLSLGSTVTSSSVTLENETEGGSDMIIPAPATKPTEEFAFYMRRYFHVNHLFYPEIFYDFPESHPDILVFTGIGKEPLEKLGNGRIVATNSSEAITGSWITSQFILLDKPSHFHEICNKTSRPVHWLQYHEELDSLQNIFMWVRSHGKVENLDDKSMYWSEDIFLEKLSTSWRGNDSNNVIPPDPICIFTNPGFGTAEFLKRAGRRFTDLDPSRNVIQIEAKEFLVKIREHATADLELTELLKTVLTDELGMETNASVELILQNFGAVTGENSVDAEFVYQIVEEIKSSFKSVRLWLTLNIPNHLKVRRLPPGELENRLGLLCYSVGNNDDLERSVVRFWLRREELPLNKTKLEQLIEEKGGILWTIPQQISFELTEEIGDDSLLALLLAEVYEDDAVEYARMDKINNDSIKIGTLTIPGLFQRWVSKRFDKYKNTDDGNDGGGGKLNERELLRMHTRLALELLFLDEFPKLEHLFQPAQLEEIFKAGIVVEESSSGRAKGKPRFIDTVFAQYFVACFVKEKMSSEGSPELEADLVEFILKSALATSPVDNPPLYSGWTNESIPVSHFMIPYFLNSFLEDVPLPSNHSFVKALSNSSVDYLVTMRRIANACARSNFSSIFSYLFAAGAFENNSSLIFDSGFICRTINNSNLEFVKVALNQFERHQNFTSDVRSGALCLAVQNSPYPDPLQEGKISILEFLMDEKGFGEELATNLTQTTRTLLHETVKGTKKLHKLELTGKMKMIRKLVGINRGLLEEKDGDGRTPFLIPGTHVRILAQLIQLGVDVLARDDQYNTVLHHASRGLSYEWLINDDYLSLLNTIPEDKVGQLLRATNNAGLTPLMILVASYEPINNYYSPSWTGQELLERMNALGADFNFDHPEKGSVLAVAITHGRHPPTLRGLIQVGADVGWRGKKGQNLLHIAGKFGREEIASFLLEECGMGGNINDQDDEGLTPLDYVLKYTNPSINYLETGLAIHKHGGRFTEVRDSSQLHVTVQKGTFNSALLLLRLGENANALDSELNTPLHHLPKYNHSSNANMAIAGLLLENGAGPNALNKDGESPFQVALKNDKLDFETFQLLKSKTNMTWTPSYATQALIVLVRSGNVEGFSSFAQELENFGADINYKSNSSGDSLLHIATRFGNDRAVHYLVEENGISVNYTNSANDTSLLAAGVRVKVAALKMVMLLIDNGADIYARKSGAPDGETFLHIFLAGPHRPSPSQFHSLTKYLIRNNHRDIFDIVGGRGKLTPYQIAMDNGVLHKETWVILRLVLVGQEAPQPSVGAFN